MIWLCLRRSSSRKIFSDLLNRAASKITHDEDRVAISLSVTLQTAEHGVCVRLEPIVSENSYGHGATRLVSLLQGAAGFAQRLRPHSTDRPFVEI